MKTTVDYSSILSEVPTSADMGEELVSNILDRVKYIFKKYKKIYYFILNVVSPVCPTLNFRVNKFLDDSPFILNLGSGNSRISDSIINLDIMPYDNVDIISDITRTPFKDASIDKIVSVAVLEHVRDPKSVVEEMRRLLKPGGQVLCFIPFIQGFHASPFDFQRYTKEGIKELFRDFEILEVRNDGGPTSGMLWIVQEWFAILFSFGNRKIHLMMSLLFMLLTWPLKFLDFLILNFPNSENISSGFTIVAKVK